MHSLYGRIGKRTGIWLLLISLVMLCVLLATLCYSAEAANHVVINEVCSNNFSVATDKNGNYSDYVELYNPAPVPVSLSGFSLSDSENELQKCLLDSVIIPAGGFYTIWLDGSDGNSVGHAQFKLSKTGEMVYFSNNRGHIIDSVEVPELRYNTVYARTKDGAASWSLQTASRENSNNESKECFLIQGESPVLSAESGFYEEAFELSMDTTEGCEIYYTLDGSNPTPDAIRYETPIVIRDASMNENIYSARNDLQVGMTYIPPFVVDKATVIRAASYNPQTGSMSEIVTKTYFVGFESKEDYNGYAIASLVTDPASLFDEDYGIYGNGSKVSEMIANGESPSYTDSNAMNQGKEWEREAVLQYFDMLGTLQMDQKVGIRISGQSTRSAAQKSFNVFARDTYDEASVIEYNFFDDKIYSSIKLRNGGSSHEESKIVDAFLQYLSADRNVAIQASRPCVLFLNGEYWGIYNIRERYKEEYFVNHYGISEGNIWMLDAGGMSIGSYDAWNDFEAVKQFIIDNDMSVAENYEKASELLDIQSLIDFYCINLYIDNTDMAFDKNNGVWRSIHAGEKEFEDCKWRFMLYDIDGSLYAPENNTFTDSVWWVENFDLMDEPVIKSLMQNEAFKLQFYETFLEISDTTFAYERVHEELMKWKEAYAVQAVKSHQRFLSDDITEEDYNGYINRIDDFFKRRPDYIIGYLEEELGLGRE